jgi:SAM-dependent methyltransferase
MGKKSMSSRGTELRCTQCGGMIEESSGPLVCGSCRRSFEIVDGIPCFAENRDYYYGEVSHEQTQRLLGWSREMPWSQALSRLLPEVRYPSQLLGYIAGEQRAGWWPLLGLRPAWRVLDLGCGWGAISFALARRVAQVMACDLAIERLRFLKIRAQQEGVRNIEFVWGGDSPRLPFGDGAFDLVVVNGVLEWVPESVAGDPVELQLRYLREAARVLAQSGQLLLGIENRWSWFYFMGRPEEHSRLPFVSLLPRPLSNIYARKRTGRSYRTYTHSYRGYRRMLRKAGFRSGRALVPLADYRAFEALVDPERHETVSRFFAEREWTRLETIQLKAKAAAARLFSPSFCWIADRGIPQSPFLSLLADEIAARFFSRMAPLRWISFKTTPRNVSVIQFEGKDVHPVVLRLPGDESALALCTQQQENLKRVWALLGNEKDQWPEIPEPFGRGEFLGNQYFVEEAKQGLPARRLLRSHHGIASYRAVAAEFLARFHLRTAESCVLDETVWKRALIPTLEPGFRIAESRLGLEAHRLEEYLQRRLTGVRLPLAFTHGDYWAGNILCDRAGQRLTGVVDWDSLLCPSIPVLDLFNLLFFDRLEKEPCRIADLVGEAIELGTFPQSDERLLKRYGESMGFELPVKLRTALLVLYWALYLAMRVERRRGKCRWEEEWLQNNVDAAGGWLMRLFPKPSAVRSPDLGRYPTYFEP